tara:strand:+ start:62 stop:607 length:546 start_codon:yes stop_codon:yes gene_type:complete
MGKTIETFSTTKGHSKVWKSERQCIEELIQQEEKMLQTYLLVFRFLKKIDGLKLGDKGREKAYEIAEQMGLNFYFRGYSDNHESTNYIYTKERTWKNWNYAFEPVKDLTVNIGYGRKAIKIDYKEICKKEFYRSVTVFRKSISAMRAALKTNKPEIIDNMEAQVKELQEQIDKNKTSIRGN